MSTALGVTATTSEADVTFEDVDLASELDTASSEVEIAVADRDAASVVAVASTVYIAFVDETLAP